MAKVLLYCTQLLATGGIESHVKQFCFNLSATGVEVDLISPAGFVDSDNEKKLREACRRVSFYRGKNRWVRLPWLWLTILLANRRRYDTLYTNGQGATIGWVANLLVNRRKWVHHHHTSGDQEDRATWPKTYSRAMQTADSVIACSQNNADDISTALQRPIKVIPCFSRGLEYRHKNAPIDRALTFGYYGRLIKEKGIELLCSLSQDEALGGIEFHFWGAEDTYDRHYFHQFPRVTFHGSFHGNDELQKVVDSLDAFILASTHPEGLPISLLEVMSAGKPWIASDRGGVRDIACDTESTVLLPKNFDSNQLKKAILELARGIRSQKISGVAQTEYYRKFFSASAVGEQWKQHLA
ncbi:MAG: glycosyltransferase family 4 protein [Pseudomonadota bacterium]